MATDNDLINRTRAAVWHPCTQMKALEATPPLAIARGEGAWLIDTDGRRYLDAISSWWVNLFGHCNPRINAAIIDQLGKIEHVMLAGATHAPVVELSERLAQLTGLGHAFYGSDGASATEIALKMSAHYWRNQGQPKKNGYISLKNGYHGETVGALSVTDIPLFKDTYAPLLRQSVQVPTPDARLAEPGESAEAYALRCADALEAHLAGHAANTAAFIVEPLVQGATGMAMYHPVYLTRARALCDQYQVHLIADEIAVGFGRTGTMFACEQAPPLSLAGAGIKTVRPDFICLSKGITGGYLPLSAGTAIHRSAGGGGGASADTPFPAYRDDLGIRRGGGSTRLRGPFPSGGTGTRRVHPPRRQDSLCNAALCDLYRRHAHLGGGPVGLSRQSGYLIESGRLDA